MPWAAARAVRSRATPRTTRRGGVYDLTRGVALRRAVPEEATAAAAPATDSAAEAHAVQAVAPRKVSESEPRSSADVGDGELSAELGSAAKFAEAATVIQRAAQRMRRPAADPSHGQLPDASGAPAATDAVHGRFRAASSHSGGGASTDDDEGDAASPSMRSVAILGEPPTRGAASTHAVDAAEVYLETRGSACSDGADHPAAGDSPSSGASAPQAAVAASVAAAVAVEAAAGVAA